MSLDFTAIDFETANGKRASVCQMGLARVVNGVIKEKMVTYVTPPEGFGAFHERNIAVHGIRARDIIGAPSWEDSLTQLIDFADGTTLVGHNVPFEISVVKAASEAEGLTVPQFNWACTLKMARRLLPGHATYSLGPLNRELGLAQFNHHDAGDDAVASAELALHAAKECNIGDLHALFG